MPARDFDLQQLRVLVELERLGSMRAVAAATGYSTSAVSAQLAALERDAAVALLEPDGRGVRLTPAGRRLTTHASTILAAVETARANLSPDAPIAGEVRVAAFSTALERECLPAVRQLLRSHPELRVGLEELEPQEALARVEDGSVDLALVYDYSLVPLKARRGIDTRRLGQRAMVLARPEPPHGDAADLAGLQDAAWIVNSRGPEDEELLRRVTARVGFVPDVRHRADALDLVLEIVGAGLGVALLPSDAGTIPGVRVTPVADLAGHRRMSVAVRSGHAAWPPVALVIATIERLALAGSGRRG